ncbi:hypothetical protein TSUD_117980 [Trifolium subterraneum]|nr:hypothetical protein TSUD_117980 [Trifolium subterraneum]
MPCPSELVQYKDLDNPNLSLKGSHLMLTVDTNLKTPEQNRLYCPECSNQSKDSGIHLKSSAFVVSYLKYPPYGRGHQTEPALCCCIVQSAVPAEFAHCLPVLNR